MNKIIKSQTSKSGEKKRERLCTYQSVGAENGFLKAENGLCFPQELLQNKMEQEKILEVAF